MIRLILLFTAAASLGSAQEAAAGRRAAIEMMYPAMVKALENGHHAQARNICDQAILWEPDNPVHPYNLACIEARAGAARREFAFAALQQALTLGFDDARALERDPDLASLRGDPRFPPLVAQARDNARQPQPWRLQRLDHVTAERQALAASPLAPPLVQPGLERPIDLAALTATEPPAPARFQRGLPVGLYFMTRPWPHTRTTEKLAWYFAPDGTVYPGIEHGFSAAELAAHAGPRGQARLDGDVLEIRWGDGRHSRGPLERTADGFRWDRGRFTPVQGFAPGQTLAGAYIGGEAVSPRPNRAPIARRLELRSDGTFHWSGVSLLARGRDLTGVYPASNGLDSMGRWRAEGFTLVLVDTEGRIYRRIAFPAEGPGPQVPARIFFGGTLYSRN